MNKSTSHSSLLVSVAILALSGFGFLYSVLVGDSHGLKAWLLPFGPWCAALIAVCAFRRQQKNDNDVA